MENTIITLNYINTTITCSLNNFKGIFIVFRESWKVMELKAKRLEVVEAVIADWRSHNIDAVISPGFAMPALKLGYPAWLLCAITYTSAYNLLNFPVGSLPVRL